MKVIALPLLFNGLFFSISPSAVHNCTPGKEVAVLEYHRPACDYPMHDGQKVIHAPTTQRVVKVEVNFYMNDKKELQVISVNGPVPGINNLIMQNINLLMPQVRGYFSVNKSYSITLEFKYDEQIPS